MNRITNFLNFRLDRLTKLSAAGALALTLAPGSVFATAIFDTGVFANFEIVADAGVDIFSEIDLSTVSQDATGVASVSDASSNPPQGVTAFSGHDVRVTGEASSDPVDPSSASASAQNIASLGFFNTTEDILEVVINFVYGADASATLDDPLLEIAGASAFVFIQDVFGDVIVDEILDDLGAGDVLPVLGEGSYTLTLGPSAFGGIQSDIFVEGLAIASPTGPIGVPAPATLALMCIGLISLALRKRSAIGAA